MKMARGLFIAVLVVFVIVVAEARPKCSRCKLQRRDEVCGSDGKIYRHACQLERMVCLYGEDIQIESDFGKCEQAELARDNAAKEGDESDDSDSSEESDESDEESPINPPIVTMVTAEPPVATSRPQPPKTTTTEMFEDVTEFVTEEFLTDVGTEPPVGMETRAPTSIAPTPCPTTCPLIDNMPVCGTDGETYTSQCVLEAEACMRRDETLQVAYEGPCLVTLPLLNSNIP